MRPTDVFQRLTLKECRILYAHHIVWQINGLKAGTSIEGVLPYDLDAMWESDRYQALTTLESAIPYMGYTVGYADRGKSGAMSEGIIENDVRKTWERIKDLVVNDKLEDVIVLDKNGQPRKNRSGNIMSAPNFPKSSEGNVFVRGTSSTSDVKPLTLNGIKMYRQQMWVKGLYIVEKLDSEDYI